MGVLETLIAVTIFVGVVGTGLGGVMGALFRKESNGAVGLLLSFAGGVMLSIVCFDLIQEGLETGAGVIVVAAAVLAGLALVYILNDVVDHKAHMEQKYKNKDGKLSMFIAGLVMAGAIAVHNVPEGMAIGVSYASDGGLLKNGTLVLVILICLHNIPAGMAIAVPLMSGGMGKIKAIVITAASGIPMVVGAVFGYWLGDIGSTGLAVSLGIASGAMLYVVLGELLPEASQMSKSKLPTVFAVVGVVVGLLVIYL